MLYVKNNTENAIKKFNNPQNVYMFYVFVCVCTYVSFLKNGYNCPLVQHLEEPMFRTGLI